MDVAPRHGVMNTGGKRAQGIWWGELRRWWPETGATSSIPELDGLRGVAVLLVMVFHAWYFVPGLGARIASQEYLHPTYYLNSGVQLFFVLSGFLLFLPYASWLFGIQTRPSTLLFYKRRLLRVGPAYWANMVILALAIPITGGLVASVVAHAVFLHNVFVSRAYGLNSVYWTMAVEVQFYVCLPAIALAIGWLKRRMGLIAAAGAMLGGLTVISLVCAWLTSHSILTSVPAISSALITHYGLPYWLSVFSAGIACSLLYTYLTRVCVPSAEVRSRLTKLSLPLFATALIVAVAVAALPTLHYLPAKSQVYGWVFAAVLLSIFFGPPRLRAVFAARPLRFIGSISYSLYLWHLVVLLALEPHLSWATSVPARSIVGLALDLLIAVPVAYLSFHFTERPFFRARKQSHDAPAQREIPRLAAGVLAGVPEVLSTES